MVAFSRPNLHQSLSALMVALFSMAAIVALQLPQLNKLEDSSKSTFVANLDRELEAEKLRLNLLSKSPSFGFHNLVADWNFINFLLYFGDELARAKTGYSLSPEYFDIILGRDPYFLSAYYFLSTSTTMYAGMPERTISLMEDSLKLLSPKVPDKSYYIWRLKGINELLFMGDSQAAQQSFETAAQWARTYSDATSQKVAMISHNTAQFLARNPQSKSAQISAWSMVLSNASDQRTIRLAINRIQALGGQVIITPQGQVRIQSLEKD